MEHDGRMMKGQPVNSSLPRHHAREVTLKTNELHIDKDGDRAILRYGL